MDLVKAYSELTAKQQSLQATYQIAAATMGLSLLNYM